MQDEVNQEESEWDMVDGIKNSSMPTSLIITVCYRSITGQYLYSRSVHRFPLQRQQHQPTDSNVSVTASHIHQPRSI